MKNLVIIPFIFIAISISFGQWTSTNLSERKTSMGACSPINNEFWFAGGEGNIGTTNKVEIYNVDQATWRFDQLSEKRSFPAAVGSWGTVIIAGGVNLSNNAKCSKRVDIYHPGINGAPAYWSIDSLSVPRFGISAEIVEGTVFFAGGGDLAAGVSFDVVDIYSLADGHWSTASLSEPRAAMGSVVGHNAAGETIIMFAGGFIQQTISVSDRVDIYNVNSGHWTTTSLSEPRGFTAATVAGNKILIAGGMKNDNTTSDRVDIYNMDTDEWTTSSLSFPRAFIEGAATVCDSAFFAGGGRMDLNSGIWINSYNVVDIYDPVTETWTIDHLSNDVVNHTVVSDGDHLLVAGGYSFQGGGAITNVDIFSCNITGVDKVEPYQPIFRIYPNPGNGTLYFSWQQEVIQEVLDLRVFNLQGDIVESEKIPNGTGELRLNLPAGTYVIKLAGNHATQSALMIIQ